MTVTGDPARPPARQPDASGGSGPGAAPDAIASVCPYLFAGDGSWQSALPTHDQRCGAVEPPVLLATSKQQQLCVLAVHRTCATYHAAQARHASTGIARARPHDGDVALWPVTRSTLVVLEPERTLFGIPRSRTRAGGQLLLIGLMAVAFLVLIVARTAPSTPGAAGASASAVAVASQQPTASPSPRPSATPAPSGSAAPEPTATPKPTPSATPAANRAHYRVKSGDTLLTIAAKFGTTIRVLKRLNDITDPRLIHPGQVLIVPSR